MGWIQKLWDGPFKTPPQQPITIGWALLKLLETLWRLLLIVILLIALLLAYIWYEEANPLSSQIHVSLSHSDTCQKGYPIRATIMNDSRKNIGEVDLKFRVYPAARSDDVALFAEHDLHDILRPHYWLAYCFPMPELQPGAAGPFTVVADVTFASELSKDVPIPAEPPAIQTMSAPPPLVQVNAAAPTHPPAPPQTWLTKALGLVVVFPCLALMAAGAFGLILLCDRLLGTRVRAAMKSDRRIYLMLLLFAVLNLCVVSAGSYILSAYGWDAWLTGFNNWSWANGLADGGMMFVAALFCLWPWAVLLAMRIRGDAAGA